MWTGSDGSGERWVVGSGEGKRGTHCYLTFVLKAGYERGKPTVEER
jgi:hypothetical protein